MSLDLAIKVVTDNFSGTNSSRIEENLRGLRNKNEHSSK